MADAEFRFAIYRPTIGSTALPCVTNPYASVQDKFMLAIRKPSYCRLRCQPQRISSSRWS